MSDRKFANGAPMHLDAPPDLAEQAASARRRLAAEIHARWTDEAAELAELEQLSCGPDRDRRAAPPRTLGSYCGQCFAADCNGQHGPAAQR